MKVRWIDPDYERSRQALNEKNDCAVVALAVAARLSYRRAHKILERAGRQHRKGFDLPKWINKNDLAAWFICEKKMRGRVWRVAETMKKGHYICYTKDHAFAVVDNTIYDSVPHLRARVHSFHKMHKRLDFSQAEC